VFADTKQMSGYPRLVKKLERSDTSGKRWPDVAARALIQMAAERGRAATLDGTQHAKMLPTQSGSILVHEAFVCCSNDVGHLERVARSSLVQFTGALHLLRFRELGLVDGRA
jgi:hypothetical protein